MAKKKQPESFGVIIPGPAVPKGRPRMHVFKSGKVVTYTPPKTREYAEAAVIVLAAAFHSKGVKPVPKDKQVRLTLKFYLKSDPNKKPDIVNLAAQLADNLTGIGYDDDCQIAELHLYKFQSDSPMTSIIVEEGGDVK